LKVPTKTIVPQELSERVEEAIKTAESPISAVEIAKKINYVSIPGDLYPRYTLSLAIAHFKNKGVLIKTGSNHGTRYQWRSAPVQIEQRNATTPTREKIAPVVMVEIPRCSLKLLVKNVMQNMTSSSERALQMAVNQAVEKLL
jgi:hypothetical protein